MKSRCFLKGAANPAMAGPSGEKVIYRWRLSGFPGGYPGRLSSAE